MSGRVTFIVYYSPFSYEEYGRICTSVIIYLDGEQVETWQSNNIVEDEELEILKKQKREQYGKV